ncbi:MAG: FGGY family carbohydrate kinase [Spirochaetaceae bacterium]|nr:FGGY family carbohydrate kinase [Spirochaetaceae bacterium]
MNFIAVDVGSTFIKVAVYDLEYRKVIYTRKCLTPPKKKVDNPNIFEVDAQQIVESIKTIIQNCLCITQNLDGILFSTQQHGCVLHHPDLQNDTYISWQDTRCLEIDPETENTYIDEVSNLLPATIMARTGVPVKPALALCNLYALFKSKRLQKDRNTKIYTLGSYIIAQLTGNNTCHITNAAPLGFVNLKEKNWDYDILKRVGLDFLQLPSITENLQCLGTYKVDKISLNVYPDLGDVQTSIYGSHAGSGDMIVNIGTSGQLILLESEYDPAFYNPNNYEIRPYYDNNYCYVISRMPGGRNFDVQVDYMRSVAKLLTGTTVDRDDAWKIIENQEIPMDAEGVTVDCGFYELPDSLANGKIEHLTHTNFTPLNVIAATAVSFAKTYRKYADIILNGKEFAGTLYFTGGAVLKNQYLKNAITKELGLSNVVSANMDEVYGGLFRLAMKCIKENSKHVVQK